MQTQTFKAREMKEALALVRRELGPDAIIVGTRRVPARAFGLMGGSLIEVSAYAEKPAPKAATAPQAPTSDGAGLIASNRHKVGLALSRAQRMQKPAPAKTVRQRIEESPDNALAAAAAGLLSRGAPHPALRRRLLAALVPRDLCQHLLGQIADVPVEDRDLAERRLRRVIEDLLGPPGHVFAPGSRVAAVVGPTGVGKTTTIAKIAARATLIDNRKVGLISLDDQRVGAIAQLRAYADLLGIPIRPCSSDQSLARTLASMRDLDLVFVDTPGTAPGDLAGLDRLRNRLFRAGEPVSTHVCVTVSTRQEELDRLLHVFRRFDPTSLIATKLDEAVAAGSMLAARLSTGIPLSYLTNGPQVPDDMVACEPKLLVENLLGVCDE